MPGNPPGGASIAPGGFSGPTFSPGCFGSGAVGIGSCSGRVAGGWAAPPAGVIGLRTSMTRGPTGGAAGAEPGGFAATHGPTSGTAGGATRVGVEVRAGPFGAPVGRGKA